ncbi:MAG: RlmE family RNA methyltransferase [Rhodospirillaceae bacterium]|jgi:23S rRNA (uridine2552-2'-O)-methyltransferase|nr:RlmE family RNA methyltransferase [Rhodospirillaceae bacterium]MBT3925928.1 RlmE family RNA methyltransferase [Rhodospirillaceae bacterium]MBT5780695.1 RlmE family RNA methyltransferase [Rhodospirillaceae bacterium]MBT6830440.1 RlmE family RNA methyltransferase [Rhodospirillaceae bacterium]MBT7290914.1 RlmE family RNA methyltransferase [Rhodospirillaceae bacterium]
MSRSTPPSSRRSAAVRVKTARGRKPSSTRWLQRQLNDPYVKAAQDAGYRSRAAFKLLELDERFGLLKGARRVLDLGAAPGGWSQVAVAKLGPGTVVVAVDISEVEALAGVMALQMDALDPDSLPAMMTALGGQADIVMSDMAAASTGHTGTDHLRVMALCEAAIDIAEDVLGPDGAFVAKVLKGGTERELLDRLKRNFAKVRHAKPPASRADSAEVYVVAQGFRGVTRESS